MLAMISPRPKGITLIELMVVVAVIAIIALFGLPGFTVWLQNTQLRTAAEGVLNGLQLARAEAVRRNTNVEFVLSSPGNVGGTGWSVQLVDGTVIQSKPNGEGSATISYNVTPSSSTKITFSGFGRNVDNADGTDALSQVDVDNTTFSASEKRVLRVVVVNGQPRMCDPSVTTTGDPRKC